jgi:predicted AlkP superfamily phosphohydrolase/phosphomutase
MLIGLLLIVISIWCVNSIWERNSWNQLMDYRKNSRDTKVFLLVLDAADPDILEYMMEKDLLPNFNRLVNQGYYARMLSYSVPVNISREKQIDQIISLPVIATLFTGVTPEVHGVRSHVFFSDGYSQYYPFSEIKSDTLWRVVGREGKTVGVVGTLGNYPIEHVSGFIYSGEYAIKKVVPQKSFFPYDNNLVFPSFLQVSMSEDYKNEFSKTKLSMDFPYEIESQFISAFLYFLKNAKKPLPTLELALELAKSNETAYYVYSTDYITMRSSEYLLQKYEPDLFIEYIAGLDYFGVMYNIKEYADYNDTTNQLFLYYKFVDAHLGNIIDMLPDNYILIVVSDHGVHEYQHIYEYQMEKQKDIYGIIILSTNTTTKKKISVYDVAPTVLSALSISYDLSGSDLI